jgi:hypothetical protein
VKRTILGTALALLLAPTAAHAAETVTSFQTVDEVASNGGYELDITGIVDGEQSPRTLMFYFYSDSSNISALYKSCEHDALLAMNRPGRYRLKVVMPDDRVGSCSLKRNQ